MDTDTAVASRQDTSRTDGYGGGGPPDTGGADGAASGADGSAADDGGLEPFRMTSIGKHAAIYGLGILLSKAVSFLMLPIYTRYLTPADYGVMSLIEMTLNVVAIMAGARLAQGVFRYYHKADSDEGRQSVVSTALLTLGISYFTFGAATFLAATPISRLVFDTAAHAHLVRLSAAAFAFRSFITVPLAFARVEDRSLFYVGANGVKLLLALSLNLILIVGLGWGVEGVFTSTLVTNVAVGLALTAWVIWQVGFRVRRETVRALLRYGVPLMGMQAATFIATFSDRYFLQAAAGESTVGLYSLAYKFGFLLAVVGFLPFEKVWGPKRFEIADRPDSDELLASGFVYANVFLLTVGVGIALFVDDLLRIMSDPSFHGAADVVPLILAAYVLQSWARAQDIGILVRERTEYVTLANWVAAGVAVLGYWWLVPRYLEVGAAVATLVAFGVRYGLTYLFSQKLWYVQYRWGPVLRLALLASATILVDTWLPELRIWKSIGLRLVVFSAYLAGLWNLGVLTDAERRRLLRLARKGWATVRGAVSRRLAAT